MTYVYDDAANRRLTNVLNSLTDDLVERLNPHTILLTGSLGRGEGAVKLRDEGLDPVSDCELLILPLTPVGKRTADRVVAPYRNTHGIDIDVSGVVKSIQLLTPLVHRMRPTIDNYDLRYGSTLLYGRDYRESMPSFNQENIPPWEGFRLVFNRTTKLLSSEVNRAYWFDKLVLALRDAVLISEERYSPSYDRRQRLFEMIDPQEFPVDADTYRTLCEQAADATERRRTCSLKYRSNEEIELLIGLLEQVLVSLANVYLDEWPTDFYSFRRVFLECPLAQDYNRFPGRSPLIQNALSAGRHLWESRERPQMGPPMTNWSHDIYTAAPLAFADRFGSDGTPSLRRVTERIVSRYHPYPHREPSVYDAFVTCWRRYCW
ncbi:hypothetical protein [Halorarius litoreus]|uniref:hypothetical protein n=1 Tax=Halorarius litoreus TaxID=2962676 RepID=UPI0020CBEDF9|nr:hypothetical protein [Halorarius litoreus]